MNILQVNMSLDSIAGGGTVERTKQLHQALSHLPGARSHILALDIGMSHERVANKESVTLLPCWNLRWYFPAPKLFLVWKKVSEADVVSLMSHWTILNALVYAVCRLQHKPYVACPAGALQIYGRSRWLKTWYDRLIGLHLLKHASAAIAISIDEKEELLARGVELQKIHHIPNGVRAEDFICVDKGKFQRSIGLTDEDRFVLFVGRLNSIKGPDLLLDAFVGLKDEFNNHKLVFLGPDGGMRDYLERKAKECGVPERVIFAGYAGGDYKSSAYHGADLVVVPSRHEAMSIVALEAAVCGTPVVLSDQCGFDALADAGAARISEVDSKSLAKHILELLRDDALRLSMGVKGKEFALEGYTWTIAANRYMEIFSGVMKK